MPGHCRRRVRSNSRWTLRMAPRLGLGLAPRQNRFHRVARLGDVGEVKSRLGFHCRLGRHTAAPVLKVVPHLLGLVGLNRTGVRLRLGHANCRQSVQYGPALDFQLSCEIVDSNFAHPSLFVSSAALTIHISLEV
jgi:hypothetical protein